MFWDSNFCIKFLFDHAYGALLVKTDHKKVIYQTSQYAWYQNMIFDNGEIIFVVNIYLT